MKTAALLHIPKSKSIHQDGNIKSKNSILANYKNAVDDLRVCMLIFFPDVSTLPSLVPINLVKVEISSCHLA